MSESIEGILIGLTSVLFIALLVFVFIKRRMRLNGREYDERQIAVQGMAYKCAYFTLMVALLAGGILLKFNENFVCEPYTPAMICVVCSLGVFLTICILKDAYFTVKTRRKGLVVLYLLIGCVNLAAGIVEMTVSTESAVPSLCAGGLLLYACVLIGIKTLLERKAGDE